MPVFHLEPDFFPREYGTSNKTLSSTQICVRTDDQSNELLNAWTGIKYIKLNLEWIDTNLDVIKETKCHRTMAALTKMKTLK